MTTRATRLAIFYLLILTGMFSGARNQSQAAELDYPELLVAPRASERLQSELEREKKSKWTTHLPIQLSAVTTLAATVLYQPKDVEKGAVFKNLGYAVSAGWLSGTVLLSLFYTPYETGLADLNEAKGSSQREKLVRERMAEHTLRGASSMGTRLTWLSVISNAAVSGLFIAQGTSGTIGQGVALAALVASFTPLVFSYRWCTIEREQQDYKKRIYGPLSGASVSPYLHFESNYASAQTSGSLSKPGLGLAFNIGF